MKHRRIFSALIAVISLVIFSKAAAVDDEESRREMRRLENRAFFPQTPPSVVERIGGLKECGRTNIDSLLTNGELSGTSERLSKWIERVKSFYPEQITETQEERTARVNHRRSLLEADGKYAQASGLSDDPPLNRREYLRLVDGCLKKIFAERWADQEGTRDKIRSVIYPAFRRAFPAEMGAGASPGSAAQVK